MERAVSGIVVWSMGVMCPFVRFHYLLSAVKAKISVLTLPVARK